MPRTKEMPSSEQAEPQDSKYTRNEKGELVDKRGNIYNEDLDLVQEAMDPYYAEALELVRRKLPNESEDYQKELAKIEALAVKLKDKSK